MYYLYAKRLAVFTGGARQGNRWPFHGHKAIVNRYRIIYHFMIDNLNIYIYNYLQIYIYICRPYIRIYIYKQFDVAYIYIHKYTLYTFTYTFVSTYMRARLCFLFASLIPFPNAYISLVHCSSALLQCTAAMHCCNALLQCTAALGLHVPALIQHIIIVGSTSHCIELRSIGNAIFTC